HLCERFLAEGHEVICVDNFISGSGGNVEHLRGSDHFTFIRHDISHPLEIDGSVDNVLHFASPASPVDYLRHPIPTLKVGSLGTHNTLGLAKAKKARFLLASTSEVYGDPEIHPQREDYWGHVNPVGVRGCYDESKRFAEAMTMAYHRYHEVDTHIVRIFNSILGDQPVPLFDNGNLHLEPVEDYARRVELAPDVPRAVLVPAFNPNTLRVELRSASALIKHSAQQEAFDLALRYGRSVKVTGDHSVFVKGGDGQPEARPVRDIKPGDYVAIPASLPVVEKDRLTLDLAQEFRERAQGPDELWDWAVTHPTFAGLVRQRRKELYEAIAGCGRYTPNKSRGMQVTLANQASKWIRRSSLPLYMLARLGLEVPDGARFGPHGASDCFLPNRIPITDQLLWLFGFYLAEGAEHGEDGTYFISFCSDEVYLHRAATILRDSFDVPTGFTLPTPGRGPSVYAHSKVLHRTFERVLGLRQKRIPTWVMQLPLRRLKHFLEGFRCGDGTHSGKKLGNELVFDTTSANLALDLNYLLLRFGIVASYGQYETTFKQKYGERRFPFHRLTVCSVDNFDILTWDQGVKQTLNAVRIGDLVWSRVRAVRPCVITGNVYDFSVPGSENFLAGNGVCCHNTYGPRMRLDDGRVVPNLMGQALRGEPLTVYGDGSQTRSFCYVDDLIEGIYRLLGVDFHEPVNLGNPNEVSILDFAKEILELSGSKSEIVFEPLPQDDPRVRKPDIGRARKLLGWEPKIDRREGMRRTLEFFRGKVQTVAGG
ncbi:MAG TPA: GDP-mannose 4,6-dehydratase, partial [Gemmataceae bacterium]|nr:GDP-mannose 4,6-dehydratase [Gemmataceae bacterium]